MHIHVLGICGTFMGGVAVLAKQAGHTVTGADAQVYPPMSTQLEAQGIALMEGYGPEGLEPPPQVVLIGNALSRGNAAVEAVLNQGLPYISGPQWLAEHVLRDRQVLAVAGTHGKTTTASMLAHILEQAGHSPGFLIGGVPKDFGVSARLGEGRCFVVEADEYDTAFFDKRSKFVHYRPNGLILNNLEFDHADIFENLAAIERQFHHLVRVVPGNGLIVVNADDHNLEKVLSQGCWTPIERFSTGDAQVAWRARPTSEDGTHFEVRYQCGAVVRVRWPHFGLHNVANALAAMALARFAGVDPVLAAEALGRFQGVKRRLELRGEVRGIKVYDDFAHHPTAIRLTLEGFRRRVGDARIVAVLEPRSNTMRMGVHAGELCRSLTVADRVMLYQPPDLGWSLVDELTPMGDKVGVYRQIDELLASLSALLEAGDQVLIMSNGGFGGLHEKLLRALSDS